MGLPCAGSAVCLAIGCESAVKEYLKKNGIRLASYSWPSSCGTVSQLLGGSAGFLTNIIVAVREPINKAATAAGSLLDGLYGYIFEYEQLQAELEATRNELADAQERCVRARRPLKKTSATSSCWASPRTTPTTSWSRRA